MLAFGVPVGGQLLAHSMLLLSPSGVDMRDQMGHARGLHSGLIWGASRGLDMRPYPYQARAELELVFVRVSIPVKGYHDHGNSFFVC